MESFDEPRDDPTVIKADGTKRWYLNGKEYAEDAHFCKNNKFWKELNND